MQAVLIIPETYALSLQLWLILTFFQLDHIFPYTPELLLVVRLSSCLALVASQNK